MFQWFPQRINSNILRKFFAQFNDLRPATRARKQASVAGFLKWALRQELIDKNPLVKLKRVKVVPSSPQGLSRQQVGKILKIIPKDELRDRLLFGLLFETGLRISEALSLYVEDVDLHPMMNNCRLSVKVVHVVQSYWMTPAWSLYFIVT